ncbi:MAG TPA: 30S ribosomal protein S7 [Saprospiraceae bacterium]|nr:30S ribosomal protein S7 [Saprospiraceae bacterium]
MRKRKPKVRYLAPDPRYNDQMVTRFVNNMMFEGKKSLAFKIFYDAMDIVKEKTSENELEIWRKALNNVMPQVEVRSRRIGGATFQIPVELPARRKVTVGMKWLITFARKRGGRGMAEKLAAEIMAAAKEEGAAVKRREDVHKMAESNRAFAHFKV